MGCWNKTCGITQFPIVGGDKVVTLILVQSTFAGDANMPCYPYDMGWNLIPIPFYGEYNDYGWQDDDDGQQAKYDFLAETFKDSIVEVEREKSRAKTCYGSMKGPFDSSQSLGDTIHGNVWNLKNSMGTNYGGPEHRKLASFMVSRIAWDKLTAKQLVTYPEPKTYTKAQIARALAGYVKYKKAQDAKASLELDDELRLLRIALSAGSETEYVKKTFGDVYGNPLASAIRFSANRLTLGDGIEFSPIKPLMNGVCTPGDTASIYLLHCVMHSLRKGFAPQTGEGSQSGIDHNHLLLLSAMKDMIKLDKVRYGEE